MVAGGSDRQGSCNNYQSRCGHSCIFRTSTTPRTQKKNDRHENKCIFQNKVSLFGRNGKDLHRPVFIDELRSSQVKIFCELVKFEHFFRCIVL